VQFDFDEALARITNGYNIGPIMLPVTLYFSRYFYFGFRNPGGRAARA